MEVPDFSPQKTQGGRAATKEAWPHKTQEATKRGALQIRVMGFDQEKEDNLSLCLFVFFVAKMVSVWGCHKNEREGA